MKTYATYGFGIAAAGFIWTLIEFLTGLHGEHLAAGVYANYAIYVIACVGLWLGAKAVREKNPEQSFTYGRALGAGMAITVFWSVGGAICGVLYMTYINPEFAEAIINLQIRRLEAKGLGQAQIDGATKIMHMMLSPIPSACFTLLACLFIGAILSLIIAAFVKREVKSVVTAV